MSVPTEPPHERAFASRTDIRSDSRGATSVASSSSWRRSIVRGRTSPTGRGLDPPTSGRPSVAGALVFDGGVMTVEEAERQIKLPLGEPSEWRFVAADDWGRHVSAGIARRLEACSRALQQSSTIYLQDG